MLLVSGALRSGSRRDGAHGGTIPKKMPTLGREARPIANDHHGSEMGKPVAKLIATPMPLPHRIPRTPPTRRQHRCFGEELEQDFLPPRAERFPHADLARALGDRDHHDRHHADAAHHQRTDEITTSTRKTARLI